MALAKTEIRTVKAQTSEIFININDLIIELMLEEQQVVPQEAKKAIKGVISRLTELRIRKRQEG